VGHRPGRTGRRCDRQRRARHTRPELERSGQRGRPRLPRVVPLPGRQGFYLIGGTSAATPQVAALTALINERRKSNGKDPLGDVGPKLSPLSSGAFSDVAPVHERAGVVVSGDLTSNTLFQDNGAGNPFTVGPTTGWPNLDGWDMTTGFGTPWAPTFVSELANS
jgi:subtilase family serine protease